MRFSCKIFLENPQNVIIPPDYRRYLLSMLKEAFKKSGSDGEDFFENMYSGNTQKPFTFSAYFPLEEESQKLRGEFFSFFFSTNDYEFLMRVYNGLNSIKGFNLFGQNIKEVKHFFLFPERRFDKDEVVFKTLSPFLVRNTEDGDYYLVPQNLIDQKKFKYANKKDGEDIVVSENDIIDSLKKNILSLVKRYLGFDFDENNLMITLEKISLSPAKHGSKESKFTMTLPAMKGFIRIKASPEVLKLIYDIGIGARRSEGFGMLEVVE
jgi:CRISPR-associated endoribonuclease Cas6